ncbi:MAG TPA: aromatic aminobenezylarsenical efflux permease ArsG family transporter [Bacteroidales bacterium]|nr:aromatic aminobenezylarsenical efflux permease ArsG family transporter [Bacteroidales bacterium]HRZ76402.1 aromatic aminobenezylarsenical efflux permease ArsG family transporter [Bacteroidales bacterium]
MEEILVRWFEASQFPVLSAFVLGLMTAISPCPLATNITAIGYISRDLANRRRVFLNGLIYTLGRSISYVGLAAILYFSLDSIDVSGFFQTYGEKIIGPVLLLLGLVMLDIIPLRIPGFSGAGKALEERARDSYWAVLLMGMLFALAFCPYSGVLYFALLIPMTLGPEGGLHLPLAFALATGLPVVLFAWLMAYAVGEVGRLYKRVRAFEQWFRRAIAILFLLAGVYMVLKTWFGV